MYRGNTGYVAGSLPNVPVMEDAHATGVVVRCDFSYKLVFLALACSNHTM
jgi:hypothetical protein